VSIDIEEVLRATGGKLLQGEKKAFFEGISTDSRTVGEGKLFIALKALTSMDTTLP
jgi:UDP-N-acetylmuramyl pentapeptide synthase